MAMLGYLGAGSRDYAKAPVVPYRRSFWEFQAILTGRALVVDAQRRRNPVRGPMLLVFPPGDRHGWSGHPGERCEVAVFHYDQAPEPLASLVTTGGYRQTRLGRGEAGWLRRRMIELNEQRRQPNAMMALEVDRHLLDLTLLILREWEGARAPARGPVDRVEEMVTWWSNHLHEGADVERLADQFAISPPHLRRIFHDRLGKSPRRVLEDIRMQRAVALLNEGDEKLETVARACGYGSAPAFSRAYKHYFGRSPRSRAG